MYDVSSDMGANKAGDMSYLWKTFNYGVTWEKLGILTYLKPFCLWFWVLLKVHGGWVVEDRNEGEERAFKT